MVVSDSLKAMFVHIPKTGGGAVATWMGSVGTYEAVGHAHSVMTADVRRAYEGYKIFTVMRDPLELYVSDYRWLREHRWLVGPFEEFVEAILKTHKFDQFKYIEDEKGFLVSHILFYDRLVEGLELLFDRGVVLERNEGTHYFGEVDHGSYYTDALRRAVLERHSGDVDFLKRCEGYAFFTTEV